MKAIILCAGYATRLYPLTKDMPKALLPIVNRPLLSYIIDKLDEIDEIDKIYVVTNDRFYAHFDDWNKTEREKFSKSIKIINDRTISNETRLEGIHDTWLVIEKEKIDDDILVICGDNLFSFNLKKLIDFFREVNNTILGVSKIDDINQLRKIGVVEIENRIINSFEEKPENPKTNFGSTGLYLFTKDDIKEIENYIKTGKEKTGVGRLIEEWIPLRDIHAHIFDDGIWYDIGSKEIYDELKDSWLSVKEVY